VIGISKTSFRSNIPFSVLILALGMLTLSLNGWGQSVSYNISTAGNTGTAGDGSKQYSWQVPAGVTQVTIRSWGGGGGGGATASAGNSTGTYRGGGGGGGFSYVTFTGLTPLETLYIQVGTGGSGGSTSSLNGVAGGATYVRRSSHAGTIICGALGGAGGTGGTNNTAGGSGASATSTGAVGDIRTGGGNGAAGGGGGSGGAGSRGQNAGACTVGGPAGLGGSLSIPGYAGANSSCNSSANGSSATATNYGAGGAGAGCGGNANNCQGGNQKTGGAGAGGFVQIDYVCPSSVTAGTSATICSGGSASLTSSASAGTPLAMAVYATPNVAIPDGNATGVTSSITISNSGINANQISGIYIKINHAYNTDIDITLTAPNGSTYAILTDKGGTGDNMDLTLLTGGTALPTSNVELLGHYAPQVAFSTFTGTANGTWSLKVADDASIVEGTFISWGIQYTPATPTVSYTWSPTTNLSNSAISNPEASPSSTTNYTMTANNGGCSASATQVTITVNTPPTAPTGISGTTSICSGGTTTLSATGGTEGSGCTYQWGTGSSVGSNIIAGATSSSYTTAALTSATTYWVRRVGSSPCNSTTTTGVTQTVTVNPLATAGTFQYANGSTQSICAGSTISCSNVTSPTNGGNGTLSVVWYCGERTGVGTYDYGNWKESTLANVSGTTSSTNLNTAAGGGSGMSHSLTNYNPQSDFPGKTDFWIIRRAYTNLCGVGVNGSYVDQSFFLTVNPLPTTTASVSATSACQGGQLTLTGGPASMTTYAWTGPTGVTYSSSAAVQSPTMTMGSTGGTFTLTATNSNGCSASATTSAVSMSSNNTAGTASSTPSLCINSALSAAITHTTTGATGIGTASNLPTGVSAVWSGNTITISGTPTSSGTYGYSIPLTGGCGSVNATGTITVSSPTLASTISPQNGDYVWQGGVSTDWSNASNWLTYNGSAYVAAGAVPNSVSTKVYVPDYSGGCTTFDPTISGTVSTDNFTITSGAIVTLPLSATLNLSGSLSNSGTLLNNGTINVEGSWVNNGTFTSGASSTVVFNGSSDANQISGTNAFNNLTINGSSGLIVTLQNDATVQGTLAMGTGANGKLHLGSKTLTVGTTSSIGNVTGGSASSYIVALDNGTNVGKIKRFVSSAASTSYSFPVGDASKYTPLTYTNVSGAAASGAYLEVYTKSVKIPQLNSTLTNYINRYWEVTPSGITSPNYNITYTYDNGDIVGAQTSFVPIKYSSGTWYKPSNSVFTTGTAQGTASGPTNNTVTWSSLTSFSQFSVAGSTGSALPVELTTFQANCSDNNTVDVTWTTASEHNTNYFRVDKSRNGTQWDVLGTIGAAGNSTYSIDYALTDAFPQPGINYYRLTQYDLDGVFETFDAQAAVCSEQQAGTALSTYPNPSSSDFNVGLQTDEMEGEGVLLVTDAKGAVVYSQNITIINGTNNYVIQRFEAAPGIYYISVKAGASTVTTKHSLR
jgi:subtilisin-like proprotein convertase family protein